MHNVFDISEHANHTPSRKYFTTYKNSGKKTLREWRDDYLSLGSSLLCYSSFWKPSILALELEFDFSTFFSGSGFWRSTTANYECVCFETEFPFAAAEILLLYLDLRQLILALHSAPPLLFQSQPSKSLSNSRFSHVWSVWINWENQMVSGF